ncbi:MAG: signal peptidase II [Hyphomicrobiales bacterium]|nr:signal peptidase II [Hyphomicrobiales bacterium]
MRRYNWAWGRYSAFGLAIAALVFAVDQAHKYWMIHVYEIAKRGKVSVAPYLDLVMVWNPGVSYGLLPQNSANGKLVLIGLSLVAAVALTLWLAHMVSRWTAASVGLIVGGALGNTVDRIVYGAVADFFSFHYASFSWYVFNIADVAIVAGVIGLLAESLFAGHKTVAKAP